MIAQFIETLRQAGLEPTSIEIAEMLYLALHFGPPAETTIERAAVNQVSSSRITSNFTTRQETPSTPKAIQGPQRGDLFLPPAGQTDRRTSARSASPILIPAASALPNTSKIARALRPFMRQSSSRTRFVLDEEQTIRSIADSGLYTVARRPAPECWLDVALVLDEGASMHVWRSTISGLQRLLERQGAFRDVRSWGFDADDGAVRLYREVGLPEASRRLRHPRELIEPAGRRLIMMVSDCISKGWHNGAVFRWLAEWGRSGPVVLIQVLPQRLWAGTALGYTDINLHASVPGVPNYRLRVEPSWFLSLPETEGVPLPIVTLEEWAIAPWARMVAGMGSSCATGMLILNQPPASSEEPQPQQPLPTEAEHHDPEKLVRQFRAAASPLAYQLACYLASVPLSFPVMRLVQQAMLPQSGQVHLAEFFLGRLIYQVTPATEKVHHPDNILYEFHQRVRELLRGSVPRRDTIRVLMEVSRFIENRLAQSGGFAGLASLPGTDGTQAVDPTCLSFAQLAADILEKFSGYEESATRLRRFVDAFTPDSSSPWIDATPKIERLLHTIIEKIDCISRYSELHDQLHRTQILYELIVDAAKAFPANGTDLEILRDRFQADVAGMQKSVKHPLLTAETPWIEKLHDAQNNLHKALTHSDAKLLRKTLFSINDVLGILPTRINKILIAQTHQLSIHVLVDVTELEERIKLNRLSSEILFIYKNNVNQLIGLYDELISLINQNDTWQEVDNIMHQIEGSVLGQIERDVQETIDELEIFWTDIKEKTEPLHFSSQEEWGKKFQEENEKLEHALATKNFPAIRNSFRRYRSRVNVQFITVGAKLKRHCNSMSKISERLLETWNET